MRKLVYGINLTIDGCCEHTKGIANEDMHEYWTHLMRDAGVLLYGRVTYQLMVPFWPDMAKNNSGESKSVNDFAKAFDSVGKIVVVSKTLKNVEGTKTKIIRSDLKKEILKLKQEEGNDILLGGVDLPEQLIKLGLVDEYRFVVQPVIAGKGRRLAENVILQDQLLMKLVNAKTLPSGFVALHYSKT